MAYYGYDPGDRNNWYQSPSIGPMGQGPPKLSVAAAQYRVSPGFAPTRTSVLDGSSAQTIGTYTGFSLYSHSYTPQIPPQQYYPPSPPSQSFTQNPQFHTQISSMVDATHSFSPIHSHMTHSVHSLPQTPNNLFYTTSQPLQHPRNLVYHHYPPTQPYCIPTNQFVPPPSTHEQPRPISDLKQVETDLQLRPIPMEPDRVCDWEVPIVDSGYSSFTLEPTIKLKGAEKPPSPPRGSGELSHKDFELQGHKDHTDAKLCVMQKSFKSSTDAFMSEFREELRRLRASKQTPAGQVDNPLKFGSLPSSTHEKSGPMSDCENHLGLDAIPDSTATGVAHYTPTQAPDGSSLPPSIDFDDNSDSKNKESITPNLETNEEYACQYENLKKRGLVDKHSGSDSSSEDDDDSVVLAANSKKKNLEFFEAKIKVKVLDPIMNNKEVGLSKSVDNEIEDSSLVKAEDCNAKELVFKRHNELEEIYSEVHMDVDSDGARQILNSLIGSNGHYLEFNSRFDSHSPSSNETKTSKGSELALGGLCAIYDDDGRLRNYGLVDEQSVLCGTMLERQRFKRENPQKLYSSSDTTKAVNNVIPIEDPSITTGAETKNPDGIDGIATEILNVLSQKSMTNCELNVGGTSTYYDQEEVPLGFLPLERISLHENDPTRFSVVMEVGDTSSGYIQMGVPQPIIKDAQYVEISASDLIKWDKAKMGYYVGIDMAKGLFLGNSGYWIQFDEKWIVLLHVFKSLEEEYGMELIFVKNSYESVHECVVEKFKLYWLLQYLLLPAAKHYLREFMLDIATGLVYFGDDFQWRGASCSQPPEFYRLHYLTTKSDVYRFGVLLLEILSGIKVIDMQYEELRSIVEWAVPLIKAGDIIAILDPVLKLPPDVDALKGIANVACSLPEHCAPSFVCYFDGWCQYPLLLSSHFHCKPSALPTCNPSNSSVDILYIDQKLNYFALGFTKHSMKSNLSSCKEACLGDCSCLVLFFENNTGNGRMHICVIVVILNVTILVLVGQVSFGFLYYLKKKRLLDYSEEIMGEDDFMDSLPGMPICFSYSTLSTTTTNFSTASQETCGAIEAFQVQLFNDSHVEALQRADWLIHKLTTEGHSGYQRNISNHVIKINMICEDHQGYEASMSHQSYKELLFRLSNKPRENLIDGMIKAMKESGMISAEAFWTYFSMTCLRPEDMPYFKGGGMLGLLFYNYILSWANVLSYLSGLCFQLGLYMYIAYWTRVGSSGKLVCLGMFADRAI